MSHIPFNRAYTTGRELDFISEAIAATRLSGNGPFSAPVLRRGSRRELDVARLPDALGHGRPRDGRAPGRDPGRRRGDHAVVHVRLDGERRCVLRGAIPCSSTSARTRSTSTSTSSRTPITPRTKAIVPVHYAGVGCDMDGADGDRRRARAHRDRGRRPGIGATCDGRPLGSDRRARRAQLPRDEERHAAARAAPCSSTIARLRRARRDHPREGHRPRAVLPRPGRQVHLGRPRLVLRAERDQRGVPLGPARGGGAITADRLAIWNAVSPRLAELEREGLLRRPVVPQDCEHNAHMYYLPPAPGGGARRAHRVTAPPRTSTRSSTTYRSTRPPAALATRAATASSL